ncbi:type 1 glutamine amidotransferase domain-containing protein [Croceicoccus naphthovorans]|uniref:Glutamine amidotransferase n=1 Tax=Croceicoccus naphthovorans TaxID=1348774 RepID=A0A0G3XHV9_9SPHN|nr:type 1 glutamine amidotransferase domain-containing protein [Croceicoccus naphthovorans]AKM10189.1 glutamine amidotransferase [Croceicoccus naphthovorans]MBB3990570.1 protease I [Croceicoccus naphthovorans]
MTRKVLIIATNGFEQSELLEPRKALENAGIETTLASPESGSIKGWNKKDWGKSVDVDCSVSSVSVDQFDGLMLPGGQMNPDILRMNEKVVDLVRQFAASGKPVAAICHAPWLLAEADLLRGKTVTGWPSIRTDLKNAGGIVKEQEVAIDGNLITSRNPDDIPAFSKALISALEGSSVAQSPELETAH